QDFEVGDQFCSVLSSSGPSLYFSNKLFCLGFEPVYQDIQRDFAWMTDEADGSVVMVQLQFSLFRECNNQGL
ncbi:MAG: hypothetical protein AB2693_02965, partial [Candidatus Thiodiazotropha sp.]